MSFDNPQDQLMMQMWLQQLLSRLRNNEVQGVIEELEQATQVVTQDQQNNNIQVVHPDIIEGEIDGECKGYHPRLTTAYTCKGCGETVYPHGS